MQPDPVMDYALLRDHVCGHCNQSHRLAALPVDGGWNVAVRCGCVRNGHVIRYSTESETFPTFDAAEVAISWLLHPPQVTEKPDTTHVPGVNWDKRRGVWHAQIKRNGRRYTIGRFDDHAKAVRARDEFLNEELEAA